MRPVSRHRVAKMKAWKYVGKSLDRVAQSGRKKRRKSVLLTVEPVTEEHVVEHDVEVVGDLLTCWTSERRPSSLSNPSGRERATSSVSWIRAYPMKHLQDRRQRGATDTQKEVSSHRDRRKRNDLCRRGARVRNSWRLQPHQSIPSAPADGGGRVGAAIDGSKGNVRCCLEQGWDFTGVSGRHYRHTRGVPTKAGLGFRYRDGHHPKGGRRRKPSRRFTCWRWTTRSLLHPG